MKHFDENLELYKPKMANLVRTLNWESEKSMERYFASKLRFTMLEQNIFTQARQLQMAQYEGNAEMVAYFTARTDEFRKEAKIEEKLMKGHAITATEKVKEFQEAYKEAKECGQGLAILYASPPDIYTPPDIYAEEHE